MTRVFPLAALGALLLLPLPATAVVIVDEDFESYADDAAFHVNWAGVAGSPSPGTPAEVEQQFELISLSAPNADFNADNVVNAADYVIWRNNLGATGSGIQSMGDANNDGVVDQADYGFWKSTFGGAPPTGGEGQAVLHKENFGDANLRVPDGVVLWQNPLDPNYQPDNSIYPTPDEPIKASVDIFLDSGALQRNTLGLRSTFSGAANLVELGVYNSDARGFGLRIQLWQTSGGGSNPDWQFFEVPQELDIDDRLGTLVGGGAGNVTLSEIIEQFGPSWHRLEMEITETSVTATLDLNRDGIINDGTDTPGVDATLVFDTGIQLQDVGFNELRFGGPSQLYTTSPAIFDNIYLEGPVVGGGSLASGVANVPEPATAGCLAVAGVALLALRRRLA